jgi:predicted  nucleic acid-binding Zn-ribbon protein
MVKTYTAPDEAEATCTMCGVTFKSASSARNRRTACPKCRESVLFDAPSEAAPAKRGRAPAVAEPEPEPEASRNSALEARVAALESAVAALIVAGSDAGRPDNTKKLEWAVAATSEPSEANASERERALAHNLGTAKAREITFRIFRHDPAAYGRATALMKIFEHAGWTVRGPEDAAPEAKRKFLVLGVQKLPVGKEAAETYLALKAAGYDPMPMLDSTLPNSDDITALSLTLPAAEPE